MITNRPTRVLYLHNPYFMGGGEMSLLQLMRALDRSRCEPYFLSAPFKPFLSELAALDVPVEVCEFPPIRPQRLWAIRRCVQTIRNKAEAWGADIFHGNGPRVNFLAGLAGIGHPLKVVYHARSLLEKGDWIDVDYWFSSMASAIICNSKAAEERFRRVAPFKPRTYVVLNGVDLEAFHPTLNQRACKEILSLPEESLVVGIVGRLHPLKGQDTFIQAAHRVVREIADAHFLIVGEDVSPERSWEAHLRAMADSLGLSKRVHFTGFLSEMPQVMAAIDCLALASDFEACPRTVLESMACGRAVVATRCGGTAEQVVEGETGYLVPRRDPEAMARRLLEILGDPSLRNRMGRAARSRAESHFGIDIHARRIAECYGEVLSGR
jgi:glycosyltransferase involved in cell wall biosynthesis